MGEGKEEEYATDFHPMHAREVRVCDDKDGVVSGIFAMPFRVCTNPFAVHPTGPAKIARSIEPGDYR
jgi:hypothetical protein